MGIRTAVVGLGALIAGGACSLALDFVQCRDSVDCTNLDGITLVCRDHECVAPPEPSSVACAAAADCVDALGDEHICVAGGRCAALTSTDCETVVVPSGEDPDDVVWVGVMTATKPPVDTLGAPLQNAVLLAASDFNSVATVGGDKVGLILCDTEGSTSAAQSAADHLIEAGVEAIVGPTSSEEVTAVLTRTTAAGVFLISPSATHKELTALADEGLIWRTIDSDVHQSAALVDLISLFDPDPAKVVLFIKNDQYGNGILAEVTDPLLVRLPSGGLVTLKYSDPANFANNDELLTEYGARIATAISAVPDTIVVAGTSEARELILFYLDTWSRQEPLPPLPRFVVTHGGVSQMEGIVNVVAESFRPALMRNISGVGPSISDIENFPAYQIRYGIRFEHEPPMESAPAYDATMVAMLAMAAAGQSPSGKEIAEEIARLVDPAGTPISFGGAGVKFISDAVQVLESGGSLDLQGVSGTLDFNLDTGDVRTDVINWGLDPAAGDGVVPVLTRRQQYVLDPPPAAGGEWQPIE